MSEPPARSAETAKQKLRRQAAARVAAIPDGIRRDHEQRIRDALWHWLEPGTSLPSGGAILATLPLGAEPDLTPLLERLIERGRRVAVAVIDPGGDRRLRFVEVDEAAALRRTQPGPRGTREPIAGRPIDAGQIAVMLVPGLAFTAKGCRLGRGGGFFDMALAAEGRRGTAVGVAFECQIVDSIPLEPHDAFVDWLCTERGMRRTA